MKEILNKKLEKVKKEREKERERERERGVSHLPPGLTVIHLALCVPLKQQAFGLHWKNIRENRMLHF